MYVLITIDCENTYHEFPFDDFTMVKIEGKCYGIPLIIDILDSRGFKGNFFLDTCATEYYGNDAVAKAASLVNEKGHAVELHTHPIDGEFCKIDRERRIRLIQDGIEFIRSTTGNPPCSHRAGGYMMDEESLRLLKECGIESDCSNYYGVSPLSVTRNAVKFVEGIYEIPVSFFRLYVSPAISALDKFTGKRFLYSGNCKFDINWLNLSGMKRIAEKFLRKQMPVLVLFLHSYSFADEIKLSEGKRTVDAVKPEVIKRFEEILNYFKGSDEFEIVTIKTLLDNIKSNPDLRETVLSAKDYVPYDIWGIDFKHLKLPFFSF